MSEAGNQTKNKQWTILAIILVVILLLVYVGVRIAEPDPQAKQKPKRKTDDHVKISLPGEQANPQDVWRGVADVKLRKLEEDQKNALSRMAQYEQRMAEMLRQTREERDKMKALPPQLRVDTSNMPSPVESGIGTEKKQDEFRPINDVPTNPISASRPSAYPPGPIPGKRKPADTNKQVTPAYSDTDVPTPFVPVRTSTFKFGQQAATTS
ncbi:MAG: hypothetical protein OQK82_06105, partial [Candidatus Pacearchaeota archaeon]|nr:hypothetical protein [Candidatus Pacearchaeota archaeon]